MALRFVILHPDAGVFLGAMPDGQMIYSNTPHPEIGTIKAISFGSIERARDIMSTYQMDPAFHCCVPIQADRDAYVNVGQLRRAGLAHMLEPMEIQYLALAQAVGRA